MVYLCSFQNPKIKQMIWGYLHFGKPLLSEKAPCGRPLKQPHIFDGQRFTIWFLLGWFLQFRVDTVQEPWSLLSWITLFSEKLMQCLVVQRSSNSTRKKDSDILFRCFATFYRVWSKRPFLSVCFTSLEKKYLLEIISFFLGDVKDEDIYQPWL